MTASPPGAVRPVPEHLHTVTPRLVVADGRAAIAFYAQAFGAEEVGERFTGPGGELIHAEIQIGDSVVMITEDAVDGPVSSPGRLGGMVTCVMALYWEDVDAAWQACGGRWSGGDLPVGGSILRRARPHHQPLPAVGLPCAGGRGPASPRPAGMRSSDLLQGKIVKYSPPPHSSHCRTCRSATSGPPAS